MIIGPLDEWLQTFADVRLAVAECDKARVVFDHYREKVTAMAEERRKLQMKGKIADKAAEEKMTRNIDKLKEVRGGRVHHSCAFDAPSHAICTPSRRR